MAIKKFPISQERLEEIIKKYPTPFHIYFEKAIRLLRTAGILLVIAGCIFGLIDQ